MKERKKGEILKCCVCKKEFINYKYYVVKTCSKECFSELNKQNGLGTYEQRFGVKKANILKNIRKKAKLGCKHTIETKIKIGLGNKGKIRTEEIKTQWSNVKKGKNRGSYIEQFGEKKAKEIIYKIRKKNKGQKGHKISEYQKDKIREATKKKKGKTWEQIYGYKQAIIMRKRLKERKLKTYEYNGIGFRSLWEVSFAKYCDKNDIVWQYEPKIFQLDEKLFYIPDFYLPLFDSWVEIKGWWNNVSILKYNLFKEKISQRIITVDKTNIDYFKKGCEYKPFNELGEYNFPFEQYINGVEIWIE